MQILFRILVLAWVALIAACGGGGGDPGGSGSGSGSGTGASNGTLTVQVYSKATGTDVAVNTFTSSDLTVHVKATLKSRAGDPIANAIVTFSETGPGLLEFVPDSATALTNSAGEAEVEMKAADLIKQGATQLVATATVTDRNGEESTVVGKQNVSVSPPIVQDPQSAVSAINFTSSVPSDKSIVIAGSGGIGRSETALLTFTVVDAGGTPVKGVIVDFSAVPAGAVTLKTASGTSNSSGQVTATVNSKSQPTSVIVNATVRGTGISTQSGDLTVTTGVATQLGFDLSASKFNMDFDLSGDSSTINVRIVDRNGNPVADGVPVVAQADFGRVGSSDRGGCKTANGGCSVEYQVQNPRPADGTPVTVLFSTQTGQGTQISDTLRLWVTSVSWLNLYDAFNSAAPRANPIALQVTDAEACKFGGQTFFVGTPAGFAAPAGTVITVRSANGISTPSVVAGSPTLDRAATRTPVEFAATGKSGSAGGTDRWIFQFTAGPSKTVRTLALDVTVPPCP